MKLKKIRRRSISIAKTDMSRETNLKIVQFKEINKNWDRCIRSNNRSLLKSRAWRKMTFNNLSIEKAIISRAELWYSWQETISDSSSLKVMKNVCERVFTIHHIYRLQEPASVYNNKAVELMTSLIIRVTKTVQVQNSIHIRKE